MTQSFRSWLRNVNRRVWRWLAALAIITGVSGITLRDAYNYYEELGSDPVSQTQIDESLLNRIAAQGAPHPATGAATEGSLSRRFFRMWAWLLVRTESANDVWAKVYSAGKQNRLDDALVLVEALAGHGDTKAQVLACSMRENGEGGAVDQVLAFQWCKKAADANDPFGQVGVSYHYLKGLGTAPDPRLAFAYMARAAATGLPLAEFDLGTMYGGGNGTNEDDKQAEYWLTRAAKQGYVAAETELGEYYMQYMQRDPDKRQRALDWLSAAAKKRDPEAEYELWLFYMNDTVSHTSGDFRFKLLTTAATDGNADAEDQLGQTYLFTKSDTAQAIEWLSKAAYQGVLQSVTALYYYYRYETVPPNNTQAAYWLRYAADRGDTTAMEVLADAYSDGGWLPTDEHRAFALLEQAAMAGSPSAKCEVGLRYIYGDGVDRSLNNAEDALDAAWDAGGILKIPSEPAAKLKFNVGIEQRNFAMINAVLTKIRCKTVSM